jgi:glycerol-1-phosphate dehydrogenase [NAD(P)+]
MSALVRLNPEPFLLDIGHGAAAHLTDVLLEKGIAPDASLAVVPGREIGRAVAEEVADQVPRAEVLEVGTGTEADADRLAELVRRAGHVAVVGIGGGRALDTAKLAAARAGVPLVAIATSLTHDGLASPVAVLDVGGRSRSFAAVAPVAIIVDLDRVRSAPAGMVRRGVGDLVSNLVAVADWQLSHEVTGEQLNSLAMLLSRTAAESILHRVDLDSDGYFESLAEALVVSGLAMLVAGSSRPCSGSDHQISHAIDQLFPHTAAHGEQVGVGTLFSLYLRGDEERTLQVDACLSRHELPRVPRDLGLTVEQFTEAVLAAPGTRPGRFTILDHLGLGPSDTRDAVEAFVARCDEVGDLARLPRPAEAR